MSSKIIKRILAKINQPELLDLFVNNLSAPDLQSLLLEVFKRRTGGQTAKDLYDQYNSNRFVRPAQVDPLTMMNFDQLAFSILPDKYEAVELSPVAPLGSNSIIAPVDQNNTIVTIRNTEVCSDPTNVLALESAKRRKKLLLSNPRSADRINLCASHRVIRAQMFDEPGAFPHFKLFSLCTAGRDEGFNKFERESISEHVKFYIDLITKSCQLSLVVSDIHLLFIPLNGNTERWITGFIPEFSNEFSNIDFSVGVSTNNIKSYYSNLRFQIYADDKNGNKFLLVDGGFTDWTQQLLSNKKERLLTSGIGSERLLACFKK